MRELFEKVAIFKKVAIAASWVSTNASAYDELRRLYKERESMLNAHGYVNQWDIL